MTAEGQRERLEAVVREIGFIETGVGIGIAAGIEAQLAAGAEMRDAALKRVPSPYPQDHPQAAFLKRKGMGLFRTMPAPAVDLPGALLAEYARLWPAFATLARVMSR